jgi:Flp pilus assembly protein TadG
MRTPHRSRGGFVLITTALSIVALIGLLGVSVDIGRMFIAKSEVQTFTDLTAIAATRELNGTDEGVTRARQVVAASQMKWNFSTQPFTQNTILFSSDGVSWNNGSDSRHLKYVFVTSIVGVDLYFIPMVMNQPTNGISFLAVSFPFRTSVKASAAAGQKLVTIFPPGKEGVLPFAPLVHSTQAPNYGFNPGDIITLRWPSNVNGNKKFCSADDAPQWIAQSTLGGGDDRGFIQETSQDAIRQAVVDDRIFYTVTLGLPVTMTGGVKAAQAQALIERANQDLDTVSTTYAEYLTRPHNERRIGVVPLVDPNDSFRVLAYAKVFLPMNQDQNGNKSLCAEYVGTFYLQGADETSGPGPDVGFFILRLMK